MEDNNAVGEPFVASRPARHDAVTFSDRRSEINWAPTWLARIVPVALYIVAGATALLGFILGVARALEYGGAIVGLLLILLSVVSAAALFALGFLVALVCEIRDRMRNNHSD